MRGKGRTERASAVHAGVDEVHDHVVNDTIVESNSGDAMALLHSQDDIDQDPNWDVIAQNGPAANDVPLFLSARERRQEAEMRFERALDEAHGNLKDLVDAVCSVAANVINEKRMKLNAMEAEIKHEFQENEDERANMSKKLEEFAANAQAQFQELMNRLANANGSHNTAI